MMQTKKNTGLLLDNEKLKEDGRSITLYWINGRWHAYGVSAYLLNLATENVVSEKMVYSQFQKTLPIVSISGEELQVLIKEEKVQTMPSSTMKLFMQDFLPVSQECYRRWVEQIETVQELF